MIHCKQVLVALTLGLSSLAAQAQTVRGTIKDAITGEPLIGATVKIQELNGNTGAVADIDGNFTIHVGQTGRYTIETSYVGYEPTILKEVMVAGSKEVVLDIQLRENSREIGEVVVRPRVNKEATVNPTALLGGVMLSMEEASRYAGGFNDPARLVTAFAGVSGQSDGNGISVHGNSPQFMQYRMEGIEVFSPNHFADLYDAGGGIVGGLNSNVIGNSDFFVSTFNANYNNALSGVFDMRLRAGNNSKMENTVEVGTTGLTWTSEGPISKKNNSSYIFNYRYGFTGIASKLGILDDKGTQLDYQDLSLKLNFPTKKSGTFSLFLMGMYDKAYDKKLDLEDLHSIYDAGNDDSKAWNALAGMSHKIHFGKAWTWRTTAAWNMLHRKTDASYWQLKFDNENKISGYGEKEVPYSYLKQNEDRIVINTELSNQITDKWLMQFGGEYSHRFFDLSYRAAEYAYEPVPETPYYDTKDNTGLASFFWSNNIKASRSLSFNVGVAGSYFLLSKEFSVEPRVSAKWEINDKNNLSIGYGIHSMIEKLDAYFLRDAQGNMLNKDLGLSKAHHLLLTYMHKFNDNLNLRWNAYYQYGFHVPVGINGSTFSTVNRLFNYIDEPLVSEGNSRNYGTDITLEQYMADGFFGQINGSLYKAEYRGLDKIWRNQRFNRGYMVKLVAGKEWMLGKRKQNVLNVSAKYTLQGGLRHTPLDIDAIKANIAAGNWDTEPIYKDQEAMSEQFDPSHIVDLTVSYKINGKKVSHTIAFEGINILDNQTPYQERYDLNTHSIRQDKSGISLPNLYYRIDF